MYCKEAKEYVIRQAVHNFVVSRGSFFSSGGQEKECIENLINLCVGTAFARSDFHHISYNDELKSHYMINETQYDNAIDDLVESDLYEYEFLEACSLSEVPSFDYLACNLHFATMIMLYIFLDTNGLFCSDVTLETLAECIDTPKKMSELFCKVFYQKPSCAIIEQNVVYFERAENL